MNILEQSEALKDLPEQVLMREMQMPTGNFPQYLVLTEIKRRKRVRDEFQRQQAQDMPTVAEEAIQGAGMPPQGVMQMAKSMAPQTSMGQNTSVADAAPRQPTMGMAEGGITRLREGGGMFGGTMTAIANLKLNHPDVYEAAEAVGDPELLAQVAQSYFRRKMETTIPDETGLEEIETMPETKVPIFGPAYNYLFNKVPMKQAANRFYDIEGRTGEELSKKAKKIQSDRALQARIDSNLARKKYDEDDPIFAEGMPVSFLPEDQKATFPRKMSIPYEYGLENPLVGSGSLAKQFAEAEKLAKETEIPPTPKSFSESGLINTTESPKAPLAGPLPTLPEESLAGIQAQQEQNLRRAFLADETSLGLADLIDRRDIKDRDPASEFDKEIADKYFPEDVNRRALDFLKSDQFTPPSEIYGSSPRAIAALEEEDPEVITQISDRLYKEALADEAKKQEQFFGGLDAEAQAQRDAEIAEQRNMLEQAALARAGERLKDQQPTKDLTGVAGAIQKGLGYVGDPTLNFLESAVEGAGNIIEKSYDKAKAKAAAKDAETERAGFISAAEQVAEAEKLAQETEIAPLVSPDKLLNTNKNKQPTGSPTADEAARQKGFSTEQWLALAMIGAGISSGDPKDVGPAFKAGLTYLQKDKQGKMAYDAKMKQIDASLKAAGMRSDASEIRTSIALAKYHNDEAERLENAAFRFDPKSARYIDLMRRAKAERDIANDYMSGGSGIVVKDGQIVNDGKIKIG